MDSLSSFSPYSGFQQLYSQLPQEQKDARILKAAKEGKSELIQILIDSGANPRARTKDNNYLTPLLCAVQAGHNESVSILLQNYAASFYDVDGNGDNALTIALWYNRKKTFYYLLSLPGQYISPDMLSAALFAAAIHDHPDEAQILINKGADLNKIHAKDGTTPIMTALTFESIEMIQLLLKNNADLSLKNNLGQNVFDLVKDCTNIIIQNMFSQNIKIPCFMQRPTPSIYPILPSCPTFLPPCYQPIISQETNSEVMNTQESLCENFGELSFYNHFNLKPSAPSLENLDLLPQPKGTKRKAPCDLNEDDRKIKKNRILCLSDLLSEFCFDQKVAEKFLRKGIAAISLCDNVDSENTEVAVSPPPPPVIFIAEQRASKRKAENDLTRDNKRVKKSNP